MKDLSVPLQSIIDTLTPTSWELLELINTSPELNFYEIRKETNLSQEKCYKELSRLEGGVLITSNRKFSDKRIIGYKITKFGLVALEQYKPQSLV
ncbi:MULTISPECIES: hypothetical protein [Bacillaceae]|uniref:Transcriptional regulator n=2 Tax=Bacillaceae TaxID=186817 RepID=A0A7V7RI18_9BACI|nr:MULTISPECIES: hypothetical protein [Bacillaceae]KAB2329462.1 hypothetical protein F7732_21290 [Bacillus mesophilum]QVY63927.1 hypothetical protein J1899_22400 [Cytobacillus gottheilii]